MVLPPHPPLPTAPAATPSNGLPGLLVARGNGPETRSGAAECVLLPALANRHGLITGATGTGKSVTLQTLAEGFSRMGVPVFMADVKGDLAGISQSGQPSARLQAALQERGIPQPAPSACPATLWDVFGEKGHPVRATVSDMGPMLLARMLGLNDTQAGVLQIVFRIADAQGLLLLDLKDLRAMLQYVGENARTFTTEFGNVSAASVGAIQRGLLQIEAEGGDRFFGEPMLDIHDFLQVDAQGLGRVNLLAADRLMGSPRLYGTFLLWMLSELFEQLPEVGDLDKPKLVFFFDEAHLLFDDAPKALVDRIELVVRLVRSKGVGVYFVTQSPLDLPDTVLGQLGNRIQHALRAFTPRDQKAVKATAQTMRPRPGLDIEAAIAELAVGEALLSLLDAQGRPSPTQRAFVIPPASRLGPLEATERQALMAASPVAGRYERMLDRDSAYERLTGRASAQVQNEVAAPVHDKPREAKQGSRKPATPTATAAPARGSKPTNAEESGVLSGIGDFLFGSTGPRGGKRDGLVQTMAKSAVRSVGSHVGRSIMRGVLGGILGKRR